MPLRKQKKLLLEAESVKLHQEKVLEEQPEEKVLEQPEGDLLEGEDARIFSSFFITFDTKCNRQFGNSVDRCYETLTKIGFNFDNF